MRSDELKGRLALITGASRGLGRQIALALGGAGADLLLVGRDAPKLDETAHMARAFGGKVSVETADITDETQIARLAEGTAKTAGAPHILVNNAGINIRKPLVEFTTPEWRQVIDTNLTSVFLMCRYFAPGMKGRGYGRILCLTSTMSHVAIPGRTAYCASKTGLLGLIRALSLELAPEAITVNGISPGPFATEMNTPLMENPELNRQFLSRVPLGRWGEPKDIGQVALFFCSEAAQFITGTDLIVDGGWTAQ